MDYFEAAARVVLLDEGKYTDNPNDPGGATNFGISSRFLIQNHICIPVQDISRYEAIGIYKTYFWDRYRFERIENEMIAIKVFDLTVNMGFVQTVKIIQESINRCQLKPLDIDGRLGPITIQALNKLSPIALLSEIKACACHFYINLCADHPQLRVFEKGWLARANR